ncbi:hypothetical protein ACH5RR_018374 [Cinchona calisaya]|uniref:Uncharacterized protein n=1 Tax=Cinchona calisaya TaxID=153742 RepID=A0ABD2ZPE2_9GENT
MPSAHAILLHLQELYNEQSRSVRYLISRKLFRCIAEAHNELSYDLARIYISKAFEDAKSCLEGDKGERQGDYSHCQTSKAKKLEPKKRNSKKREAPNTKHSRSDSKKDKKNNRDATNKEKYFHCSEEGIGR